MDARFANHLLFVWNAQVAIIHQAAYVHPVRPDVPPALVHPSVLPASLLITFRSAIAPALAATVLPALRV